MKKLYVISVFIVSVVCASAQFDITLLSQWESTFQNYAASNGAIGMSVAIRSADEIWTDQFGVSSLIDPLTENHVFAMGSVSKTITTATILQMSEEDLLSLEDPLHLYIDSYANVDSTVTIRQLLSNTSGIYNITDNPQFTVDFIADPGQILTPEQVITDYVLAPSFPAGTDYEYSNSNFILLGMIIEAVADQSYYLEARERFDFDTNYPSMGLIPFEVNFEDLAHLWTVLDGVSVIDVQAEGISFDALFSGAGAAGAYGATPKDLSQWIRDLYTGQLLQPSTMENMLTGSVQNNFYGLGVILVNGICDGNFSGHTGGIAYTSASFYDSTNDIAISVHTNDNVAETDMGLLAIELFCDYNDFVSSVSELNKEVTDISVFPNPFSDVMKFSFEVNESKTFSYQILDELGREIFQFPATKIGYGKHIQEVYPDLNQGMYILKIQLDEESYVRKIIKE